MSKLSITCFSASLVSLMTAIFMLVMVIWKADNLAEYIYCSILAVFFFILAIFWYKIGRRW